MQIDLTQVIKSTVEWQEDDLLKSSNFDSVSKETIEDIKIVMFDVAIDKVIILSSENMLERFITADIHPQRNSGIVEKLEKNL
jgi:hypothetical protein